jgi:hypothetical protein
MQARSHAVRALGSLVLAVGERISRAGSRVDEIVQSVCSNVKSGPFKVRWNACHTLGKMFQNPHFPMGQASWTQDTLMTLAEAISQTRNYKVRIHACSALCALQQRVQLGNQQCYVHIVQTITTALASVDSMEHTVFSEFKYVEQLKEQLITCCHFLQNIAQDTDRALVSEYFDAIQEQLSRESTVDNTD